MNTNYWRVNTDANLTGILNLKGLFSRWYDTDNSNYMTLSHSGAHGTIQVEGSGFDSLRLIANSSGACQFTVGGQGSTMVADDATVEFSFNNSAYGIWIVTNSYNDHAYAIIACAGTAATAIYAGTSAAVGLSGTNPNTDTKANYWIDGSGHLWIKNRLGSNRRFNAYHFGG